MARGAEAGDLPAEPKDVETLKALQESNAARLKAFYETTQQMPNFTSILLDAIISLLFVKGSRDHVIFMQNVEENIDRALTGLEGKLAINMEKAKADAARAKLLGGVPGRVH